MKLKKYILLLVLLTCGIFNSCDKYLLVDPKNELGEEALFKSADGFQFALNGLYAQLATGPLYGDNLTMGFVSLMAQNYSPTLNPNFVFLNSAFLNFKFGDALSSVNNIWSTGYNTIAGTNIILSRIDEKKAIFLENNYARVKAETLTIRALVHFDLLRLYAANYTDGPDQKAIPYRTELDGLSQAPGTIKAVTEDLLRDLDQAEALFKQYVDQDNDSFNRFRMSIYTVTALKARIHIYRGEKEKAYEYAKALVDSEKFQLIPADLVATFPERRDRTFSTEQILALRVRNIRDWAENKYFKPVATSGTILSRREADFNALFETSQGGSTDIRFANLVQKSGDNNAVFYTKYWQTWNDVTKTSDKRLDQNVSIIRISEMYYILAETAPSLSERQQWLNTVRKKRVLSEFTSPLDEGRLKEEILKEYQKDFYAEGQTFFYYKRINSPKMLFSTRTYEPKSYILPIPDSELEFNPNYN